MPQQTVAELRKIKACVLMLTQFFLGTGQRIRFISSLHLEVLLFQLYIVKWPLSYQWKKTQIIKKLVPIIAVVLVHNYENISSIFF